MNRITNILAPIDFSGASQEAIQYAARLALALDARLVVAHVVPSFAAFSYALPGDPCAVEKQVLADAGRKLPAEIPAPYRTRLDTRSIVRSGDVRDELLNIVESEKIDIIVMGTHGRRALERFFLGSTTENMIRRMPVPILTVSPRCKEVAVSSNEPPVQRVVYATDLSETTHAGFRYCVELVRSLGAQLTLLHVLDAKESFAFENNPDVRDRLEAKMRKMIESEDCVGLPLKLEIGHGTPYLRIFNFAEEAKADLLVINLQSKDQLERPLLGSTAERVIRSSRIPVLSIPSATVGHALRVSNTADEVNLEPSDAKIA